MKKNEEWGLHSVKYIGCAVEKCGQDSNENGLATTLDVNGVLCLATKNVERPRKNANTRWGVDGAWKACKWKKKTSLPLSMHNKHWPRKGKHEPKWYYKEIWKASVTSQRTTGRIVKVENREQAMANWTWSGLFSAIMTSYIATLPR